MPQISTPVKKTLLILFLTIIATFISLPNRIPLNIKLGKINIKKDLIRPDINFKIGKFEVKKSFDLFLGLDLAGGSHLVFEADASNINPDNVKNALDSLRDVIERRVNLFGVSEPVVQTSSFAGKNRIIVELPGVKDTKEAVDIIGKTAQLIFAEVPQSTESASFKLTDLTGADLSSARVGFDEQKSGKPVIQLQFSKEGGDKFEKITSENIGKPLAIILDNEVVSAPIVQEIISGGQAAISGDFTLDQAKQLSLQLNAGALPISINLVEERTVEAILGTESVNKSIRAGVVGILMVLIFMVLSYGWLGIIADLGLIVFGVLTLSLYKLIPVVLTLPGIAGFLLSVGMAVDSNILIFERYKEEKLRRNTADALEISFGRAWDSIRDANIASLVTAFILANPFDWSFLHTSGPVRGFAITLALGIGISLFTGIYVSRNLLRVFVKEKKND
ncbi:MAG: protein translocase subunit SecD [Patescibacteria group bacterium]|nr:protein translocase subunit SecD [Patescibacteria group bacterium]